MSQYRSDEWEKLAQRRQARKIARNRIGDHPLSHVDPDRCYEWMRADCAAHESARQSREDGLVSTITQISSAALLAIPGLLFGADQPFPRISESPWLYAGISSFLITLILAMLEQFLSGKAYRRQTDIARCYYLMQSDRTEDSAFVGWVRRCRNSACIFFGLAILMSAGSLMMLERNKDGKSTAASSAPTSAPTAASSAPTASSSAAIARLRRIHS